MELPAGVSFPGAYKYSDPGIVHDVSQVLSMSCGFADLVSGLLLYQDNLPQGALHYRVSDPRYGRCEPESYWADELTLSRTNCVVRRMA